MHWRRMSNSLVEAGQNLGDINRALRVIKATSVCSDGEAYDALLDGARAARRLACNLTAMAKRLDTESAENFSSHHVTPSPIGVDNG